MERLRNIWTIVLGPRCRHQSSSCRYQNIRRRRLSGCISDHYPGWRSMTSFRQIEANRRNASKSTGPITEEGKQRSRCNAVRHGLTAETVISLLEDAEDYNAFEAAIIADYDVQSAVERELVLRLASLLWRLRRATTMKTGLFEIQADYLRDFRQGRQTSPESQQITYARFGQVDSVEAGPDRASHGITNGTEADAIRCFRIASGRTKPPDPVYSIAIRVMMKPRSRLSTSLCNKTLLECNSTGTLPFWSSDKLPRSNERSKASS